MRLLLPGVSAQPGCIEEKWISLCWDAHLSVRITCCLYGHKTYTRNYKIMHALTSFPVFSSSWLFFLWGKAYFILGVGHGAVKCSLLKLQIIQVQLLNQHAPGWHRDLKARKRYTYVFLITIIIHLYYMGEQSCAFLALLVFPFSKLWSEILTWTK